MDLNQLIAQNGACFYLIIFVWTFLEGETVVLFAGFAAAQGLVDPVLLLIAAWLGSIALATGDDELARKAALTAVSFSAVRWIMSRSG